MKKIQNISILDRTIAYFSPERALKRLEARTRLSLAGGYVGSRRNRRQTENWNISSGSADNVTLDDLPTLRERSRDLLRNAPLAIGAVNTVVTNVVGTALKVQSHIDREVLKPFFKNEESFDKFERNAERIFRNWSESNDCDVTRSQNFTEIQNLILRSVLESGDIFVLKRQVPRKDKLINLSLQLVEADRIATPQGKSDNKNISAGVEMDSNGAPIAYHICNQHPDDYEFGKHKKYTRINTFDKYDKGSVES